MADPLGDFNTIFPEPIGLPRMLVVDSRGTEVARFEGKKNPPKRLAWDGLQLDGSPALRFD